MALETTAVSLRASHGKYQLEDRQGEAEINRPCDHFPLSRLGFARSLEVAPILAFPWQ